MNYHEAKWEDETLLRKLCEMVVDMENPPFFMLGEVTRYFEREAEKAENTLKRTRAGGKKAARIADVQHAAWYATQAKRTAKALKKAGK